MSNKSHKKSVKITKNPQELQSKLTEAIFRSAEERQESIEEMEERENKIKNKPIDDKFLKSLIKESVKKDIEVFSNHREAIDDSTFMHKRHLHYQTAENPLHPIVKGITKIKVPIRRIKGEGLGGEFIPKKKLDLDSPTAKKILSGYGSENYTSSVSTGSPFAHQQPKFMNIGMPDIDARLLDTGKEESVTAVETGKGFFEKNKEEMKQQMNVVAFYSIKDSKPFYYVSSAEARLAIDFINECRNYKKDIFRESINTIKKYVKNVSKIIIEIKARDNIIPPMLTIWNGVKENDIIDESYVDFIGDYENNYLNIKHIDKQVFIPQTIEGAVISVQKFEIKMRKINIYDVRAMIDLHEALTLLYNCAHYIVCGSNIVRCVMGCIDSNSGTDKIAAPNMTESELFGIMGKYKNKLGSKQMFFDNSVDKNSYIIVSKDLAKEASVFISEYQIISETLSVREEQKEQLFDHQTLSELKKITEESKGLDLV